jgi:hypothetical protein
MNADAADLADAAVLRQLLAERSALARPGRVAVAFACGTCVGTASAGDAPIAASWPIGCVAKLVTATLVRHAAQHRRFELDDDVTALLGAGDEALRGVSVSRRFAACAAALRARLHRPRGARAAGERARTLRKRRCRL